MTNGTTPPSPGETPPPGGPPGETPPITTLPPGSETPPSTTPPLSSEELQRENERLTASLKRANKEAKDNREKAEALDKLKAELEQSKLSETERLQTQLATLQAEHTEALRVAQENRVTNEVLKFSVAMNLVDADAAVKLLDWTEIEYDDAGRPTNMEKLLKDLVKAKPYLQVNKQSPPPSPSAGATNPPRSQSGRVSAADLVTQLRAGQLSSQDYAALPIDVRVEMNKLINARGR